MEKPSELPRISIPEPSGGLESLSTQPSTNQEVRPEPSLSSGKNQNLTPRTIYANRKTEREATSLQMMMHMNAKKVRSIQAQFEAAGKG